MAHGLQPAFCGLNGDVPCKQLFGGPLTLRDYDAPVGEAMAMIRTLNKMTRAGMPVKYADIFEMIKQTSKKSTLKN